MAKPTADDEERLQNFARTTPSSKRRRLLEALGVVSMGASFGGCLDTGGGTATPSPTDTQEMDADQETPKRSNADVRPPTVSPPTSQDLRETGDLQRRWLSHPMSRLVLEPQDGSHTNVDHTPRVGLPLRGAFHYGTEYHKFTAATTYFHQESGDNTREFGTELDFETGSVTEAETSEEYERLSNERRGDGEFLATPNADANLNEGMLTISIPEHNFGRVEAWQTVDVDAYPQLFVNVAEANADFTLKVTNQELSDSDIGDITISRVSAAGEYLFDIQSAVNEVLLENDMDVWEQTEDIQLRLFAVGGTSVTLDQLQFVNVNEQIIEAGKSQTDGEWAPHAVWGTGAVDDAVINSRDYFYDEGTVVRHYDVETAPELPRMIASGQSTGQIEYDASTNTIAVEMDSVIFAISAEQSADFRFYSGLLDFLSLAEARPEPTADGAYWDLTATDSLTISLGVATPDEGVDQAMNRASRPFDEDELEAGFERRRNDWDDFLENAVPHPENFELSIVDSMGVPASSIKHNYYAAWVYLRSQILPESPEIDFPHPQLAGPGKPSTASTGPTPAVLSNAWDSMVNLQLYAYADPETAWDIFEGFMETVTDNGYLRAWETLPTRWGQTAKILYVLTDDEDSLRSVYPAIKRYLRWKIDNPWWKHDTEITPESSGDTNAAFATHALADARHMADLAGIIAPEDVQMWKNERADLFDRYLEKNWDEPDGFPYQWGTYAPGWTTATTAGLYLSGWSGEPQFETLKRRFHGEFGRSVEGPNGDQRPFNVYEPSEPFAGFSDASLKLGGGSKYPLYSYTVYGLLKRGMMEEAETMIEAGCRDIARSNVFSEHYQTDGSGGIVPGGNRPSGFGASQMIDLVLMKNGYRYDRGEPLGFAVSSSGGVSNIPSASGTLAMRVAPGKSALAIYIDPEVDCVTFEITQGDTVRLADSCDLI